MFGAALKLLTIAHLGHELINTKKATGMDTVEETPTQAPGSAAAGSTAGAADDTVVVDKSVTNVTVDAMPNGAAPEGKWPVNFHPVSVELKHVIVFGLIFMIAGLGLGFWEDRQHGGGWKVITGFTVAGLLVGVAVGFGIPARKRFDVLCANGQTKKYYKD